MMRKDATLLVVTGFGLGVAGVLAYMATRSAGPVPMTKYTELREGPLMEHLVSREELGLIPATEKMHYPGQVAPGITKLISQGWTYTVSDPQILALPAEVPW